ncbi:MAG TPA: amino acid permease [Gemmatimonadales bacterium]|nr:amino acid permease [Gemmatimonadales bacterium]
MKSASRGEHGGLTALQGTALYVGAVLGTGIIALPALAAQIAGPASLLAWLALVLLSALLAVTFAALGARYPDAGGVSTYVGSAFGPRAAAIVGWCFYFAVPPGAPAAAMFGGAYVAAALGGGQATVLVTAAVIMVVVTLANAFGLRVSGRLQVMLASLLVLLLVAALLTALPHARLAHLRPFAPHGWLAVGSAAALLVWSCAGWEAITSLVADFRRPEQDLPRAVTAALIVVGVLYLGIAAATVLVLGPAAESSTAPLADLLAIGIGSNVRVVAAAAAVLLTLGVMNAYYAGAAKLGAALGRDGALPAWLAQGSSAGEVPRRSLAVVSGLSAISLAVVGAAGLGPRPLVLLTTGSFVLVYVLSTAAAVRLLPRGSWSRRSAALALVAVLVLLGMTGVYLLWTAAVAVAASVYLHWRRSAEASAARHQAANGLR